jgi:two-component system CheB/CheR fusion protein
MAGNDKDREAQESEGEKKVGGDGQPGAEMPRLAVVDGSGAANFAIVGVGASAGGLEAFSQLLRALPKDAGLAIVFVQHVSPQHESALATLLTTATHMNVVQPTEDTLVEPDHVYVIPPNRNLALKGRTLLVQPRPVDRSQYTPVDTFFQSLAKEQDNEAIGVILSGTASDGVEGIHAIKAAGGMTLVQDPETAKQDGMPRAAIATGKVDLVLAPAEIADELARVAREMAARGSQPRREIGQTLDSKQLDEIFALLRASSGVDFGQYKLPTVQRRIQRRMALHKASSVEQYLQQLRENPPEVHQLYQDILIHVTRFFREPESFKVLVEDVFPSIVKNRSSEAPIRIWVPACSTGEEPYSVAISLVEFLDDRPEKVPIQIFATDISETAIEQARAGVYSPAAVEDLSPERLRRFFTKTDGSYRINKPIRDLCVFARQDLTRDPPFSKLDLIVCRNVLIYLGQAIQNRLISVFHYALKPTGYLMLGSAETIGTQTDLFSVSDKKQRIYRKKHLTAADEVRFTIPYSRMPQARSPHAPDEFRGTSSVGAEANRLILDRYGPAGVIVNEELRIVQFLGQTGRFLEPAPGDASLNLLKMCREGLLHGLRTALQNAKKKDGPVRREGLRVKANGDFLTVTVEVVPLASIDEGRHYLILFQDVVRAAPVVSDSGRKSKAKSGGTKEYGEEIERLQRELVASREYLQSIIQDLEAANEELQSANEEILSSNEELQSTNEELDTAKEELQSTNEELNTVNEELHGRNEELARTNSDLINLLNGVQVAIVIVARDLRIRRFTPVAERVLNLIAGDVGRPIGQIKPNINCPDLERQILRVIDTMDVHQQDVLDSQGRMYSLTIRPYKSVDNRIDGAVLALFDVDDSHRHAAEAQAAQEYAEAVFNTVREPLVVLNVEMRIQQVNPAFCSMFQLTMGEVKGRLLYELAGGQWNVPKLRLLLEEIVPANTHFENFEVEYQFDGGGAKRLLLNGRRVMGSEKRPSLVLLAIEARDRS